MCPRGNFPNRMQKGSDALADKGWVGNSLEVKAALNPVMVQFEPCGGTAGGARLCRAVTADGGGASAASISGQAGGEKMLAWLASLRSKWGSMESRPTKMSHQPLIQFGLALCIHGIAFPGRPAQTLPHALLPPPPRSRSRRDPSHKTFTTRLRPIDNSSLRASRFPA